MEYVNYLKAKAHIATASKSEKPVISKEDEQFLDHITSEDNPPPLGSFSNHGGDAQLALMDGAQNIALPPETPGELETDIVPVLASPPLGEADVAQEKGQEKKPEKKSKRTWNWLRRDSRDANRQQTAQSLHDAAEELKAAEDVSSSAVDDAEAQKEEEEMTVVLERLNLAAVNNRVFSISDETQELLTKFNLILKDLIRGVPTAYDDLESLLTNGDRQLQKTFNSLPTFLQKLIENLPETMTKGLAPEIMAVAAERANKSGINLEKAGKAAGFASKMLKTPNLKDLAGKPSAIAGMMRSVMTFLRTRFPAFAGMNVLWSLALFVVLLVFWYCYKRGKEVRLEKERELTEQEITKLDAEYKDFSSGNIHTTTAEPGASIEEVHAGMVEAQAINATVAAQSYTPSIAAHTRSLSTT